MVESVEIVAIMTLCKAMIATVVALNETITMPATAITASDCAGMTTAAAAHLRTTAAAHYFGAAAVAAAMLHECHGVSRAPFSSGTLVA
jgi:hypothetical protein